MVTLRLDSRAIKDDAAGRQMSENARCYLRSVVLDRV